jgi:hypothetical protein
MWGEPAFTLPIGVVTQMDENFQATPINKDFGWQ